MIAPARAAALDALLGISAGRLDLPDAVAATRRSLRDDRDRALAAEITIGVQRWRATLDHLIAHFSKRHLDRLDHEVVEILRLSAYQLLYLKRVPASAIVDDAVKLTGRAGKRSASGLVNAVLRAISRSRQDLPLPPRPEASHDRRAILDYLAVTLSHPRWLAERWLDRYGFDATERWLRFNNAAAPLTLRANRFRNTPDELIERLSREAVTVSRGRFAPDALIVDEGRPLGGPGLDEGWFVVQDEASQLVALLTGASPGARVLDTCASPGGKTTAIAAGMPRESLLVACDIRDRRMELLRTNCRCHRGDQRSTRAGRSHAARRRSRGASIACSWTRRARASARCGAIRTSNGVAARTSWRRWRLMSSTCSATAPKPWSRAGA